MQCVHPSLRSLLACAGTLCLLASSLAACSNDTLPASLRPWPSGADAGASSDDGGADEDGGGRGSARVICASCGGCEQTVKVTSANHVDGTVPYTDLPPAGGDHNACWATWGVHAQAVAPEHWVHNLEHGGVVFLYNCADGCKSDVAKLETLVTGRTQALLTPYAKLPGRFAVVSWGHRLVMSCLDTQAMLAFYTAHVDHAPESLAADPPSSCTP